MRLDKIVWILLVSLFLTNCTATRSNVGATLGATTTTGVCVEMGVSDPYAIAACAVTGAFAGADKNIYDGRPHVGLPSWFKGRVVR